jgi:hypothetical protein
MTLRAIEMRVCFKNKLKNTDITIAAEDLSQARRIARIWGEKEGGGPVTRTIFKQEVSVPDEKPEIVDGVKVLSLSKSPSFFLFIHLQISSGNR